MVDGECECDGPVVAAVDVMQTGVLLHPYLQLAVVFKQHSVAVRWRLVLLINPHHTVLAQLVTWHKLDWSFLVAGIIALLAGVSQLVELR